MCLRVLVERMGGNQQTKMAVIRGILFSFILYMCGVVVQLFMALVPQFITSFFSPFVVERREGKATFISLLTTTTYHPTCVVFVLQEASMKKKKKSFSGMVVVLSTPDKVAVVH